MTKWTLMIPIFAGFVTVATGDDIVPKTDVGAVVVKPDSDLLELKLLQPLAELESRIHELEEENKKLREFKTAQRRLDARIEQLHGENHTLQRQIAALHSYIAEEQRSLTLSAGERLGPSKRNVLDDFTQGSPNQPTPKTPVQGPQNVDRYSIHAAKKSTILLDSTTGDTWKLKDDKWVQLERELTITGVYIPAPQ